MELFWGFDNLKLIHLEIHMYLYLKWIREVVVPTSDKLRGGGRFGRVNLG